MNCTGLGGGGGTTQEAAFHLLTATPQRGRKGSVWGRDWIGEGKSLKMQRESHGDVEYRSGDEGGGRRKGGGLRRRQSGGADGGGDEKKPSMAAARFRV